MGPDHCTSGCLDLDPYQNRRRGATIAECALSDRVPTGCGPSTRLPDGDGADATSQIIILPRQMSCHHVAHATRRSFAVSRWRAGSSRGRVVESLAPRSSSARRRHSQSVSDCPVIRRRVDPGRGWERRGHGRSRCCPSLQVFPTNRLPSVDAELAPPQPLNIVLYNCMRPRTRSRATARSCIITAGKTHQ